MTFQNLTPHTITLVGCGDDGQDLVIPPTGAPARVSTSTVQIGTVGGVPVRRVTFGDVTGVPASQPGVSLIVSRIVADALASLGRIDDIFIVDGTVRDANGAIIGATGLATVSSSDPAALDQPALVV